MRSSNPSCLLPHPTTFINIRNGGSITNSSYFDQILHFRFLLLASSSIFLASNTSSIWCALLLDTAISLPLSWNVAQLGLQLRMQYDMEMEEREGRDRAILSSARWTVPGWISMESDLSVELTGLWHSDLPQSALSFSDLASFFIPRRIQCFGEQSSLLLKMMRDKGLLEENSPLSGSGEEDWGEGKSGAEADREQDQPASNLLQAPQRVAQESLRTLCLCDAEVALIIFFSRGKLYEFGSVGTVAQVKR